MELKNKIFIGTFSTALISGAILWEGTKYDPYWDIVGVLTVCHGYTGKDIIKGKRYTPQECDAFLKKELGAHQIGMLKCINVPINQNQHDAFLLFTYNIGVGAFCSSSVLQEINKGKLDSACKRLYLHPNGKPAWSYAGGKYVQGLQNRRQYEHRLCIGEMNVKYKTT